jgi:hypothetical protein
MIRISARSAIRALIAAAPLAVALLIATGALAQEIKLTRSAASGIEMLLVDERSWDANCKPLATSVTIISQPSNGKVTVVPGASVIAVAAPPSGSKLQCAGKSMTGNQIMYRSNPGFRGTDTLAYKVLYANGKSGSTTVTINVH